MIGAKHLYLIDFDGTNLPNLKETIEKKYPDVKVRITAPSLGHIVKNIYRPQYNKPTLQTRMRLKVSVNRL